MLNKYLVNVDQIKSTFADIYADIYASDFYYKNGIILGEGGVVSYLMGTKFMFGTMKKFCKWIV